MSALSAQREFARGDFGEAIQGAEMVMDVIVGVMVQIAAQPIRLPLEKHLLVRVHSSPSHLGLAKQPQPQTGVPPTPPPAA